MYENIWIFIDEKRLHQNAFTVEKQDAEDARSYLLKKIQRNLDKAEFDALGVGEYGHYEGPDTEWLQNKNHLTSTPQHSTTIHSRMDKKQ